jgi:hypothetical protein
VREAILHAEPCDDTRLASIKREFSFKVRTFDEELLHETRRRWCPVCYRSVPTHAQRAGIRTRQAAVHMAPGDADR